MTDPGTHADHVVVFDEQRAKYFRIRKREYALLTEGGPAAPLVEHDELFARAARLQLLEGTLSPEEATPARKRSLGFFPLLEVDPTPVLDRLAPAIRTLLRWPAAVAIGASTIAGVTGFLQPRGRVHLTPQLWLAVSIGLSLTLVVHELGHAAMVVKYGGSVRRVGLALMYLRPICFCDVSSAWEFPRRRQRMLVSLAGILVNFTFAMASWAALWIGGVPSGLREFLLVFGLGNLLVSALNFFPFIKLDGYWMLASALDRPNLRKGALSDVEAVVRRVVLRAPRPRRATWSSLAFGVGCVVAPLVLVALGLQGTWVFLDKFGPTGNLVWLVLTAWLVVQSAPPAAQYVRAFFTRDQP